MKTRWLFCLAGIAGTLAAGTCWAGPYTATPIAVLTAQITQQVDKTQTVSGTITSVGDNSFSIEVKEGDATKTMEFLTNQDTKIEGELKTGATARVTYRVDGNKNVATQVIVSS